MLGIEAPENCRTVVAEGYQQLLVIVPDDALDPGVVGGNAAHLALADDRDAPLVVAGEHHAVAGDGNGVGLDAADIHLIALGEAGGVPLAHGAIVAAGNQALAVRRPDHRNHVGLVAMETALEVALQIENAQHMIT
ncbi:hypothetical protein D3C85_1216270 [compost metagenome]